MEKLKILKYRPQFQKDFQKEKAKIQKLLPKVEIQHIGSTAVSGLGGKGVIDILIGIDSWKELDLILEKLKNLGFVHIHPKENGRVFLSPGGFTGLGDSHIHIVKKDGKEYRNLLAFRNYLKKDKKEAEKYFNLKLEWLKKFKGHRAKYTAAKEVYVQNILKKTRKIPKY